MTNDTMDLTPDFKALRQTFSREARNRASTVLADLLPEELIEAEHIKAVQLSVLREFQQIINSIDMVVQCTTNLEQVVELRALVHEVSQTIIKKADEVEYKINTPDLCDYCGRSGVEVDHEDQGGHTICVDCNAKMEDDEKSEPEEGDWVTNNHIEFTQHGYPNAWAKRIVVADCEDWRVVLKGKMDFDKFWPDVWFISDHGNCHQLDMNDGQHLEPWNK